MFDESALNPREAIPIVFWQIVAAGATHESAAVAPYNLVVITSIDVFYYGGATSPTVTFGVSDTGANFVNWRPETSSQQSFHWGGQQVLYSGEQLVGTVEDATFDWRICGWSFLSNA